MKHKLHHRFASFLYCQIKLIALISILLMVQSCNEKEVVVEEFSGPLFTSIASEASGVTFINALPETPEMNILTYQYLYNGAGVSVGDINNDGLADIFFNANFGPNHLYLNKGDFTFEEIGRTAGVGGKRAWSTGCTMVDINNDGFLDIYLSYSGNTEANFRKNELFINNGDLTFTEKASEYGLADTGYSTQASFFDYDKDGDLDMFMLNHPINPSLDLDFNKMVSERNIDAGDRLYRNDGGKFIDVSEAAGIISNSIGYGLSASIGDINNDGWPDVYVCNDFLERDYLYVNNGDGSFSEKAKEATRHISNFSMGSDMADFNNDGLLDLMVVDMVAEDNYRIKTNMSGMNPEKFYSAVNHGFHHQYMMNTLQMNNGNGTFSEVSKLAGVGNTDWSWAPLWADFDNDGLKDLFVTNGLRKEARNNDFVKKKKVLLKEMEKNPEQRLELLKKMLDEMPSTKLKNYSFKNGGDISFSNVTENWGLDEPSFSTGAAYADFDNDGDLDIVISNIDNPAFIYKNNGEKRKSNQYLKVKLKGPSQNTSGIGARITLKSGGDFQMKEHYLNHGYLSSMEDKLHFGLGTTTKIDSLWVEWPDGSRKVLANVAANKEILVAYEKGASAPLASLYKTAPTKMMAEVTEEIKIDYKHQENEYNDFEKESLLPHKMSMMGPGMAVADVNGDGLDDFYVGGAKGFAGKLYEQQVDGTFVETNASTLNKDAGNEDVAAVFFDVDQDGDQDLYLVSGGNEFEANSQQLQDRLYLNDGTGSFQKALNKLPKMVTSGGCVAVEDYDGDGDLDLFVGGRVIPGQYPKAPRSYLLRNDAGVFVDVTSEIAPGLLNPGLVTSAIWTDYDKDGKKDLMVTGEWMPITVYKNDTDGFVNVSEAIGLTNTEGWWYSITAGDFDNDGDEDYMLGNLGQNYKYQASLDNTFDIYYDDFDDNKTGDIVLSYKEDGKAVPLRGRQCSSEQMPFIKEKFGTYDEFAKASMEDIFDAKKLKNALHLEAKSFASVFIKNNGANNWEVVNLPRLAQLSSVNSMLVHDVDNDGNLDAILSGNLYASEVETPRNDAGNGLVLKGDGAGGFKALTLQKTGFFTPRDSKELHFLTIKNKLHIAVVNNNDVLQFFQF
ncbi:VCBS repeat-containing protein [Ulvibacter litoralis]|uniref:Repeat domain-containing protein n=1 Tax=Ulvibacter litoralis TaxID=227084 RepID=A0A1G7IZR5_9FLAO|nr:VCBS repeat-containing protein [Ulvibacter litoralis]SDF18232.1 Repeat domain-containing protein [Ulvibacter litoralis]